MPELPEVEAARKVAHAHLVNHRLVDVVVHEDEIVFDQDAPGEICNALRGRMVIGTDRRGKYQWLKLDAAPHLLVHFGMTGRYHVLDAGHSREDVEAVRFRKMELLAESGVRLIFADPRRLGRVRLKTDPDSEPPVSKLGFDPLISIPRGKAFADAVCCRKAPIKALLLDQGFAAGVGNWIADEVLYQAKIDPHRRACDLNEDEVAALRKKLRDVIHKAVEVDADSSRFPRTWLFHHRWGKQAEATTHRGERVEYSTVGGRTTAWVPEVQR
ncbi:MAG: Fpg/Nei family DNA glycosylase [Planctomycetota bacterium]